MTIGPPALRCPAWPTRFALGESLPLCPVWPRKARTREGTGPTSRKGGNTNMNTRNFSKASEAVSPVVATLLLVLVAAGAAIGFGVFLNGFQKNTQSKVSGEAPAEVLHIGGSSTVFELTEKALPTWNSAHPSIKIDDQEGGSDAGLIAICHQSVDIGASSKPFPKTGTPSLASCPVDSTGTLIPGKTMQEFIVGYDGVAMAWNKVSGHCTGMALTTPAVRELYAVNGAGQAATADDAAVTDAVTTSGSTTITSAGNHFASSQVGKVVSLPGIPAGAYVVSVASGGGSAVVSQAATATNAAAAATISAIVSGGPTGAGGLYSWKDLQTGKECTGSDGSTNVVKLSGRSDNSGTADGFCNKVLGFKKDGVHCTNDASDQPVQTYYTKVNYQLGNDGIQTYLDNTPDALSYIGFGIVANDNNLGAASLNGVAPSAATIKAAAADSIFGKTDKACDQTVIAQPAGEYCAVRPLEYVTAGTPSATEQLFLDFMLQTLNNVNFCKLAGYVSIYA